MYQGICLHIPLTGVILPRVGARPLVGCISSGTCWRILESGCLRVQPKLAGKLLLRLNILMIPIANKYREGKLQRTLKREFKRT